MDIKILKKLETENNREYAYRLIRYNIMSLQILPGVAINEGELAELLNVSRTPIREAILMLKDEDLVEVIPQSGSKVSLIDISILKEGHFLRSTIEPEIINRLAGNMNEEEMNRLKENLKQQQQILEMDFVDKIDDFVKMDDKFHKIIYEADKKNKVWHAVKRISSHYDRARYLDAIMNNADLNEILKEHQNIYYSLLIGYSSEYLLKKFYENHLGTYKKNFKYIMEKYPEYFRI